MSKKKQPLKFIVIPPTGDGPPKKKRPESFIEKITKLTATVSRLEESIEELKREVSELKKKQACDQFCDSMSPSL